MACTKLPYREINLHELKMALHDGVLNDGNSCTRHVESLNCHEITSLAQHEWAGLLTDSHQKS